MWKANLARPYWTIVLAVLAAAFAAACGGSGGNSLIAEGNGPLAIRLEQEDGVHRLHWDGQESGSRYHVSGTVTYWLKCVEGRPDVVDDVDFGEVLLPGVTEYTLPEAIEGGDFFLRALTVDVFISTSASSENLRDSMAFTEETVPCD